ncbi:uncharacterized protein LOC116931280 [Daphnia magna]|uniref:uncharacterized protein LOC116931280 n=1 Tax=Daphnia magna TaxID=35525 RepID=UPI001E1BC017|nr:uncharacterized protein LOC116931280 [Daphnia magna]
MMGKKKEKIFSLSREDIICTIQILQYSSMQDWISRKMIAVVSTRRVETFPSTVLKRHDGKEKDTVINLFREILKELRNLTLGTSSKLRCCSLGRMIGHITN